MSRVFEFSRSKASERLVLLAMADEASDTGELTAYRRSHSHFARKANVSEDTVRKAIKALVKLGEVEVLRQGDGREQSNYQLHVPEAPQIEGAESEGAESEPPTGMAPEGAAPSKTGTPSSRCYPGEPSTTNTSASGDAGVCASGQLDFGGAEAQPPAPIVPDPFDAWWKLYPRKVDKKDARKAYARALGEVGAEVLADGLLKWVRYWERDRTEARHIAHPTTWLNRQRWESDPPPPARQMAKLNNGRLQGEAFDDALRAFAVDNNIFGQGATK